MSEKKLKGPGNLLGKAIAWTAVLLLLLVPIAVVLGLVRLIMLELGL